MNELVSLREIIRKPVLSDNRNGTNKLYIMLSNAVEAERDNGRDDNETLIIVKSIGMIFNEQEC